MTTYNDIFVKNIKSGHTVKNNLIHINFSESVSQVGGDNIVHISMSNSDTSNLLQNGGENSEYFERLSSNIMNSMVPNVNSQQTGGLNIRSNLSESSVFLSSNTIDNIKSNDMSGGAKNEFNFAQLKKHLKRVVAVSESQSSISGGSSPDETLSSLEEDLEEENEEDDEDDEIFSETKDSDSIDAVLDSIPQKKTTKTIHVMENDADGTISTLSTSTGGESEGFEFSESVSSPQLMSYRKVNSDNTLITGKRNIHN